MFEPIHQQDQNKTNKQFEKKNKKDKKIPQNQETGTKKTKQQKKKQTKKKQENQKKQNYLGINVPIAQDICYTGLAGRNYLV